MHLLCQTRCLKCSNSFIIRVWSLALCLWQASALRVSVRVQRSSDALLCNEMSCAVVNATRCVARRGRNGPVDGNACMQHVNSITRRWNRCSVAIALHRSRGRDDAEDSIWSTFSHSECSQSRVCGSNTRMTKSKQKSHRKQTHKRTWSQPNEPIIGKYVRCCRTILLIEKSKVFCKLLYLHWATRVL